MGLRGANRREPARWSISYLPIITSRNDIGGFVLFELETLIVTLRGMKEKAHGGDLRKGRVSIANQVYMITTATRNRSPVFRDLIAGRVLVRQLRAAEQRRWSQSLAFVIMPDHMHWLLALGGEVSLSTLMNRIKGATSRQLPTLHWQRGFHDHAVRREQDMVALARYIVANPIRAGLVESVRDYSLWDAVWV